jgi:hypothetical protein
MVDINKLVESYYNPNDMTFSNILQLIEEQMGTAALLRERATPQTLSWSSIPDIAVSEIGWSQLDTTEEGIEIPSEQRAQLQNFLSNISGEDLQDKIRSIAEFYESDDESFSAMVNNDSAGTIARVMSYLVFYKTLTTIITNFNASSAGFSFESFLAVLLGGQQVPTGEGTIADLRSADGTPISLKLYREEGVEVGGSYTDLVNDLAGDAGYMQYVVVAKSLQGKQLEKNGRLDFYRFNLNLENIINILYNSQVGKNQLLIQLPTDFIENPELDYNENLPAVASGVSTEELEALFADSVKKAIRDGQKAEILLQTLDWANRTELFKSGKRGRIPGHSHFLDRVLRNVVSDLVVYEEDQEGIFSPDEFPKIIDMLNAINNQVVQYRKGAASRRADTLKQVEFSDTVTSVEFYNSLDPEAKRRALKNTRGYLFTDHFQLNKTNVKQIEGYAENTLPEGQESVYIGSIKVGVANVQAVLDRVTGAINEKVFDIFNNVKVLTTNIQAYFAGGLQKDEEADNAIGAAQSIETKTEEIKAEK